MMKAIFKKGHAHASCTCGKGWEYGQLAGEGIAKCPACGTDLSDVLATHLEACDKCRLEDMTKEEACVAEFIMRGFRDIQEMPEDGFVVLGIEEEE